LKVIISRPIVITIVKEKTSWINIPVCLQSEQVLLLAPAFCLSYLSCQWQRVAFQVFYLL
ncbi:hypothetical protein, partial [Streptococcus dysgalactiae]